MTLRRLPERAPLLAGLAFSVSIAVFLLAGATGSGEASPALESENPPPNGLNITLWAREPMLKNPVALSHDPEGRLYVTETARRRTVDLDVRGMDGLEPLPWQVLDWTLHTVEERRDLIRTLLAPDSPHANPWHKDWNGDGQATWHDLTAISERVHLLEDTDGDGTADSARVFADGFQSEVTGVAGGVLWYDGAVYMTVIPDLWRLEDHDGDGRADARTALVSDLGVHIGQGGHDLHGLTVGPDGRIYWSIGDKGINVTTPDGRHFEYPNQGVVMRSEPDGTGFEVYAHGLRNCQELSFDDYGHLFCVDNDGDFQGERERFVYVAQDSDAGWRINWQQNLVNDWGDAGGLPRYNPWMEERLFVPPFEGQAAYITPPIVNYSDGPAGFKYNPGTALSEAYEGYFFVTQFPGQLITAFQVRPRGAGYEMVNEQTFYKGIMATGLSFGPEGALYVADWSGGWAPNDEGGIYRFDVQQTDRHPLREETQRYIREGMTDRPVDSLVVLMAYPDQRVRLAAQFELGRREASAAFVETAYRAAAPQLARIHALWGLGRLVRLGKTSLDRSAEPLVADPDPEIRAQAARFLGEADIDGSEALLLPLLEDESPRVRYQAAMALAGVGSDRAVAPLIGLLAEHNNEDPFLRHAAVRGLTGIGDVAALAETATHPSKAVRLGAVVALRRLKAPDVAAFLDDADEQVALEAARAVHDDFSIPEALPALARLAETTPHRSEALLRRALNANLRLGETEHLERLLAFAADEDRPEAMQVEALGILATWTAPPVLDRVERRYRLLPEKDPDRVIPILKAHLTNLTGSEKPGVQRALMRLMRAYDIEADDALLFRWLADENKRLDTRLEALDVLREQGDATALHQGLDLALRSETAALRERALDLLVESEPEEAVAYIEDRLGDPGTPVGERQHAVRVLGETDAAGAPALLGAWLERLEAGTVPDSLALDVFAAALESPDASLRERAHTFEANRPELLALMVRVGGDREEGRRLFQEHPAAQCARCHADGGEGSDVGPDLVGIGARFDRPYLVEALLEPSKQIADGYRMVSLTLDSGEGIAGTLIREEDEVLELRTADGAERVVSTSDVARRTDSNVSMMPPMGPLLTPTELRDVVAYLASLREARSN